MLEFLISTMLPERDHPRDAAAFAVIAVVLMLAGAKIIGAGVS